MGEEAPKTPLLFLKPPSCLVEDGSAVILPAATNKVHHEVELAVVVGKRSSNIEARDWRSYVYGYAIFLDITARDLQDLAKEHREPWTVSKGFDTFGPISAVTRKERIADPHRLEISLKLNGAVKQHSNTSMMIFKIPEILEYASTVMTLEPGDIISTGTPEGVGEIRNGDRMEAEIEGLGSIKVSVKRL